MSDRSPLSEALWSAWGAIGVSSWFRSGFDAPIDIEALAVTTALLGDERLFLETIDWAYVNGVLVAPSRLRRMDRDGSARVAAWVRACEGEPKDGSGRSGKSTHALDSESRAAATALRLRAVFGTTARIDVLQALHPVVLGVEGPLPTAEVARRASITPQRARPILDALEAAGVVARHGSHRRSTWEPRFPPTDPVASTTWSPWLQLPWVPWHLVVDAAHHTAALTDVTRIDAPASAAVRVLTIVEAAEPVFRRLAPGVDIRIRPGSITDVLDRARSLLPVLERVLADTLLNGKTRSSTERAQHGRPTGRPRTDNPWAGRIG